MMGGYGMHGGYGFGGFFMIVWWVLIIIGIIMLVKWLLDSKGFRGSKSRALDILNERYARGEIDEEEYKKRKSDLSQ
ncbi:MAG: SHOCT domain-containing protein [Gallionellaceae bacterium]|jgi:putative membrane protein